MRTEVASYIKEKPQHFKPFWLPPPAPADETERINLEQMEGGSPPTSWESYLDALDRPGRRADDLTFRALTRRLNCRILLLVGDVKSPEQIIVYGKKVSFQDDRKQVVIPVLYKERHYQLVAPKPGREIPTEWLAREPGGQSQTVPRGGGWLPSCCSSQATGSERDRPGRSASRSVRVPRTSASKVSAQNGNAWLPPRASSSSAATSVRGGGDWLPSRAASSPCPSATASLCKADRPWLPSRAASSEVASHIRKEGKSWLPARAASASSARGSKRKASSMGRTGSNTVRTAGPRASGTQSDLRTNASPSPPEHVHVTDKETPGWCCKVCNQFVYPTATSNLSRCKSSHIAKHHPHLPKSTFGRLRAQVLVQTQPAHVLPQPYWKCAWCHEGLPKLETAVYVSSVRRHLRRCAHAPKNSSPGANAIELAKAIRLPQLPRFLKARTKDPARALTAMSKSIKVWERVLRQRARLQQLGHDVHTLLRAEKCEPEPRLFFTCSRCFGVKARVNRLQKWTQRCASDEDLQTERQKQLRTLGPNRAQLYTQFDQRNRRKLCDVWNMTAAERGQLQARVRLLSKQGPANQWIRDVTADGDVEPNPGPSSSSQAAAGDGATDEQPRSFDQWYVNLGGCEKLYDMLELLEAQAGKNRPSASCFAETRTSPADQARITRKLQVLGYSCFWSPSVTSARRGTQAYWRGGLCIAAARHVPCRQVAEWSGDADHIIALDYESFRAVGIWRRPGQGPLAF